MYILQIDRPKRCIEDYHPRGTTVTVQLDYSEMVLLEHALCSYKDAGGITSKENKFFYWQFHALREICKQGSPTSWIAEHYNMLFSDSREEADDGSPIGKQVEE